MLFLFQSYRKRSKPPLGGYTPPTIPNKTYIMFTPSYEDEEALLLWLTLENLI